MIAAYAQRLLRLIRPRTELERAIEQAVRGGVGLYRETWEVSQHPAAPATLDALADSVRAWCAHEMGQTRRPFGVDHMAVGVACAAPGGSPIASVSIGVFRPADFYSEGGTGDQIADFVRSLPLAEINRHASPVRIAAALFSWGDLARATIFRD